MNVIENYGGKIAPEIAEDIVALLSVALDAYDRVDENMLSVCYTKAGTGVRKYAGEAYVNADVETPVEARAYTALQWMLDDMLATPYESTAYWAGRVEELAAWFPEIAVQRWMQQGLDRETSLIAIALEAI